jgi:hypothetical protein
MKIKQLFPAERLKCIILEKNKKNTKKNIIMLYNM